MAIKLTAMVSQTPSVSKIISLGSAVPKLCTEVPLGTAVYFKRIFERNTATSVGHLANYQPKAVHGLNVE